jgi:outer membrane protein assembly factor BamB
VAAGTSPQTGTENAPILVDDALVFGLGHQQLFDFHGLYALETDDGSTRWHRGDGDDYSQPLTPAYPAGKDGTVFAVSPRGLFSLRNT